METVRAMKLSELIDLAEKAGAFPLDPNAVHDKTMGFRERALMRFTEMVANECVVIMQDGVASELPVHLQMDNIRKRFAIEQ